MNAPFGFRLARACFRLALVAATAAGVAPLSAQSYALDRGSLILAGNAGISSVSVGDQDRQTLASLSPRIQYLVSPGLALGGRADFNYLSSDGQSHSAVAAGPEASYYFGRGEQTLYPFVSATGLVGRGGGETNYTGELSAGLLRMLSRSVGLDGRVYYRSTRGTPDWDVIGFALGFSAFTF